MKTLFLTPDLRQRLLDHAREALPNEAVGLLGGRKDGRVQAVIPLPNLAGPRAFFADPWAQFQAERALEQAGHALLAIYHSHPGGGVELSSADHAFAAQRLAHVGIALARPHRPGVEVRAYSVSGGEVTQVEISIDSAGCLDI